MEQQEIKARIYDLLIAMEQIKLEVNQLQTQLNTPTVAESVEN
ncbi:MAG: hypothetical protein ACKOPP_03725 [Bacteroidota bacterium]